MAERSNIEGVGRSGYFVPGFVQKCTDRKPSCMTTWRRSERIHLKNVLANEHRCSESLISSPAVEETHPNAMEHKMFCIKTTPESSNEGAIPSEYCEPTVVQKCTDINPRSIPTRRSGHRSKSICKRGLEQLTGGSSSLNQKTNMPSYSKNCEENSNCLRPRKMMGKSNEGELLNSLEQNSNVIAQPITRPSWRGSFSIFSENFDLVHGLAAHFSNKACPEVFELAHLLPPLLCSQMLSRLDVWPESFNLSPPTDDIIDLYIFPENERCEKVFDNLLNDMTEKDLAMKIVSDNTVLLVFTSLQLPYHLWRALGKYYLWAVFCGKNTFFPYPQDDHHSIRNFDRVMPSDLANDMDAASDDARNLSKNWDTRDSHKEPDQPDRCTLGQGGVEVQPPTGRITNEGLVEGGTCRIIFHGSTEITILTNSIDHDADVMRRSEVEKDPENATNKLIGEQAPGYTAIKEVTTANHFQEVNRNFLPSGYHEGEAGIKSIGASSAFHIYNTMDNLIRDRSDVQEACSNQFQEVFSNPSHQGCSEGQGTHSHDGVSSHSIGTSVLQMASTFDDLTSSDETSSADISNEQVGPYFVKPSLAPILRAIIDKHGDIACNCPLKSVRMLSSALERVCIAVQDFEAVHFINLQAHHLKTLYSAIVDAELVKLNVKWLRNRYDELTEAVDQIKQYKNLKVARRKNIKMSESKKKALELKRTEMMNLQSDIQSLESQVALMTEETESLNHAIGSITSKCKHFRHNSLMDGLL